MCRRLKKKPSTKHKVQSTKLNNFRPGNPVKLARSLWPEALELRGDVGARALARDRAVHVDCTGTGSATDVDTLEDLERLQQEDQ